MICCGSGKKEGLREKKRQATLQRIAESGLKLFSEKGYDETTLEAIAEAAGISARTFFYYFKTKDEVLQYWQGSGIREVLGEAMRAESPDQAPIDAVRNCLLKLIPRYESEKSVIVDRILNSSETLRARKQAIYYGMEMTLFEAMCALWPEPERRRGLRMVAMVGIGAMRLAMEARRHDAVTRKLAEYLEESFEVLGTQI